MAARKEAGKRRPGKGLRALGLICLPVERWPLSTLQPTCLKVAARNVASSLCTMPPPRLASSALADELARTPPTPSRVHALHQRSKQAGGRIMQVWEGWLQRTVAVLRCTECWSGEGLRPRATHIDEGPTIQTGKQSKSPVGHLCSMWLRKPEVNEV